MPYYSLFALFASKPYLSISNYDYENHLNDGDNNTNDAQQTCNHNESVDNICILNSIKSKESITIICKFTVRQQKDLTKYTI